MPRRQNDDHRHDGHFGQSLPARGTSRRTQAQPSGSPRRKPALKYRDATGAKGPGRRRFHVGTAGRGIADAPCRRTASQHQARAGDRTAKAITATWPSPRRCRAFITPTTPAGTVCRIRGSSTSGRAPGDMPSSCRNGAPKTCSCARSTASAPTCSIAHAARPEAPKPRKAVQVR